MSRDSGGIIRGSLDLMVLKTLNVLGPLHGYRIARRIEQISGHELSLNQGTLYPALVKLESRRWIAARWSDSETGRRVKTYSLTVAGRRQLERQEAEWRRATGIVERFFDIAEDES